MAKPEMENAVGTDEMVGLEDWRKADGAGEGCAESMAWRSRIARLAASMNVDAVVMEIRKCPPSAERAGGLAWWNEVTHLAEVLAEEGRREQADRLFREAMASENFLGAAAEAIEDGGASLFVWLRWREVASKALKILARKSQERERAARMEGAAAIARSWASGWGSEAIAFFGTAPTAWIAGAASELADVERRRILLAWTDAAAGIPPNNRWDEVIERARQSLDAMMGANVVDLVHFPSAINELLAYRWGRSFVWCSALAALIERIPAGEDAARWAEVGKKIEETEAGEENTALAFVIALSRAKKDSVELRNAMRGCESAGARGVVTRI